MRPISVRFKCFGPYMTEQFVDFEELQKSGLFLICGETGAGKTTILDAICYALYGRSSGGLRGDLSVMRCKMAEKEDETLTEFIFDSNGKRYKFVRSLKYGRKKLNDSHNCLVMEGEEYVPLFENPKATYVNQKAQELIGLTYDQFRQVIILPQGQFEKLLVSDSAEKEKILVSLFHADRWQKIADELYRRVAEEDAALKEEKLAVSGKLKEYGCESTKELEEKVEVQQAEVSRLKTEAETLETEVSRCRRENEQAILDNAVFEELAKQEKLLQELLEKTAHYDAEELLLAQADLAETIGSQYRALQDTKEAKLRAAGQVTQCENAAKSAQQELTEEEAAWEKQEAGREEYEEKRQQILLLENARELYRSLTRLKETAGNAKTLLTEAKTKENEAEAAFVLREEQWHQANLSQKQAIQAYQMAQEQYLRGIGSTLAQKLVEGEPCPVCGSREHPAPAEQAEGHITDAQLEEKNVAMNQANDAVTAAMKQRSEAEKQKQEAAAACSQAAQTEAVARADYENALSRRIGDIETETQLEDRIQVLQEETEAYETNVIHLRETLDAAKSKETASRAKLETAREDLTAAQARYAAQLAVWEAALSTSGLETEERFLAAKMEPEDKQRRRMECMQYRTDLVQTRQRVQARKDGLEGQNPPDLNAIRQALQDAESRQKQSAGQLLLAEKALDTMTADVKHLKKREKAYSLRRGKTDGDLDFANRLRGRSGVSLQRYVLGVMLTSIAAEANRLLANVYGGRYRLYRTDEISGSGHKGGLELEVYDNQNHQRRSVTTLSGGEKFLVALSLAIGLSTVVQAQGGGIRLEAMFIDEGFGSLDREAVHDALEVLQTIQRSSGVVGIISHVETLAEIIPTRLEITKGRQGSTCRLRG